VASASCIQRPVSNGHGDCSIAYGSRGGHGTDMRLTRRRDPSVHRASSTTAVSNHGLLLGWRFGSGRAARLDEGNDRDWTHLARLKGFVSMIAKWHPRWTSRLGRGRVSREAATGGRVPCADFDAWGPSSSRCARWRSSLLQLAPRRQAVGLAVMPDAQGTSRRHRQAEEAATTNRTPVELRVAPILKGGAGLRTPRFSWEMT